MGNYESDTSMSVNKYHNVTIYDISSYPFRHKTVMLTMCITYLKSVMQNKNTNSKTKTEIYIPCLSAENIGLMQEILEFIKAVDSENISVNLICTDGELLTDSFLGNMIIDSFDNICSIGFDEEDEE